MSAITWVNRYSDYVNSLLDKNLLLQLTPIEGEEEGESRFGMLETIREYGLERLAAVGELRMSRERHAAYFLDMVDSEARAGAPDYLRPTRLDLDHANLRAALEYRQGIA